MRTRILVVTAALLAGGCASDSPDLTAKRLSGQGSCDLVTGQDVSKAAGIAFGAGQAADGRCSYPVEGAHVPVVTIGAAVRTTGDPAQPVPPGMVLNTTPEDTTVGGVPARQMSSKPRSDMCTVDVLLTPGDVKQMYSVMLQIGADQLGMDTCKVAKDIAQVILEKIPG